MGHVLQLRREGIPAWPHVHTILGAFVAMKRMPRCPCRGTRRAAGPCSARFWGLATLGLYAATREPLFLGLAYFNFIINLFNLARCCSRSTAAGPSGRCLRSFSCSPVVDGRAVLCGPDHGFDRATRTARAWHRWKIRNTPEGKAYYDLPLRQRVAVGVVYLGLIAVLGLLDGGYVRT